MAAALTTEGIFPGAAPGAPVFRYKPRRDITANRPASDAVNPGSLFVNTTTGTIQYDTGAGWVDITGAVTSPIPVGTVMPFFQAAAPSGWTQIVTQNDKVLRVVSGAGGGSGGTIAVSTGFAHTHTVSAHTHTLSAHTHAITFTGWTTNGADAAGTILVSFGAGLSGDLKVPSAALQTGVPSADITGSSSPTTDSQLGVIQYIDMIICSKN